MKLLLDIGNTRVKWARVSGRVLVASGSFRHQRSALSHARLDAAAADFREIVEVWAACVAGSHLKTSLGVWTAERWQQPPRLASVAARAFGVSCGYRDHSQLGVDRWLALVAARARIPGPVCVVDAGTAITIDVMDGAGQHLGGVILPGLRLMRRALARGTGELPEVPTGRAAALAASTAEAILAGTEQAASGAVERLMSVAAERCGRMPSLVLTGGDAPVLAPSIGIALRQEPLLVLRGLALVAADPAAMSAPAKLESSP